MYSIYAGNVCIYDDTLDVKNLKVIAPTLKLADSAAGSLDITIPQTNVGYSLIEKMKTEIVVKKHGVEYWSGRVLNESIAFVTNRKLYCEGELAYLNDSTQPPAEYHDMTVQSFMESLLTIHNSKVSASKRFKMGIVTVTDPNNSVYRYTNREKTMECINKKLVEVYGGHLRIRKVDGERYLDYLEDYPNTNTQIIEFGKNLLDFTANEDMSEYATVIIPLGARLETSPIEALDAYLTVKDVNDGNEFVTSSEAIDNFGWIEKVVTWDNVTEPTNLLTKATEYLTDIQFSNVVLEIGAVDLHYLDVDTEAIKLLDAVRVKSAPHGMDRYFPVSKLTIPLANPENTTFTMGTNVTRSLTEVNNKVNSDILAKIDLMPKKSEILADAKSNATALITTATNGFVTILPGENESRELLITNDKDYRVATKVWRWNINGLGYSSTGYNGTYGLAMTMDGSMNADFVTTGVMNANLIRAGRIQSPDGTSYWDLTTGEVHFEVYAMAIQKNTEDITALNEDLSGFSIVTANSLTALQGQIDGSISTWFYQVAPTDTTVPTSNWNTTDKKNIHLGDLYYDTITGYCYRYQVVANVYSWTRLTDTDVTKALSDAAKAQDTADSKRRNFTVTPFVPYDAGDLWTQGTGGDLMRCKTGRIVGSYSALDWEKASKYTDDTVANANLQTAKTYADTTAAAAQTAANEYATAKANLADASAKAYADGILSDEEQARLAAATADLNTAKAYADVKKTEAQTAAQGYVNALQIGGRNIVHHSAFDSIYIGDWTIRGSIYTIAVDNTNKINNCNSLKIIGTGAGNGGGIDIIHTLTQTTPINDKYMVSFWAKSSTPCILYIRSGAAIYPLPENNITTAWTKYTIELTNRFEPTNAIVLWANMAATIWISQLKVEKGNKATDWTAAPEDTAELITSAQTKADNAQTSATSALTKLGEISNDNILTADEKQTIRREWDADYKLYLTNCAQADVFAVTTEKTNYTNALTTLGTYLNGGTAYAISATIPSWISDANLATNTTIVGATFRSNFATYYNTEQLLLNAIAVKAKKAGTDAQSAIDNLKIGGRNLVRNSKVGWTSLTYRVMNGILAEDWIVGETYTVSIKGTALAGKSFGIWRDTGSVAFVTLIYNATTGIYTGTAIAPTTTNPSKNIFSVYTVNGPATYDSSITWIKIEKGNKATDWTPAPEDTQAATDAVDFKFTNIVGCTVNGNVITSAVGGEWGTIGVSNTHKFNSGDSLEFKVLSGTRSMFGLSTTDANQNYNTIQYGIYAEINGAVCIYEGGSLKYTSVTNLWSTSSIFAIKIVENKVNYYHNGVCFYISETLPVLPLVLDCAFYMGVEIISVKLGMSDSIAMLANNAGATANNALNSATTANEGVTDVLNALSTAQTELAELQRTVSTQFTQTSSDFTFAIQQALIPVTTAANAALAATTTSGTYIKFVADVVNPLLMHIMIGDDASKLVLDISNNAMVFKINGTEVASFSNNKLIVKDIEIKEGGTLRIGKFAFIPRSSGNLSLRYLG